MGAARQLCESARQKEVTKVGFVICSERPGNGGLFQLQRILNRCRLAAADDWYKRDDLVFQDN